MKTKLKKWPRNWVEHVNETCFFYFEDKDIFFIDSKILCLEKTQSSKILGIRLSFQKYDNVYDIFINYEGSSFVINYYYKSYYKVNKNDSNFIFMMDTILSGADNQGVFNYFDLGGQAARDDIASAFNITESIENIINFHSDRGGDDDEGGENDPCEPFSPYDVMEPELLSC